MREEMIWPPRGKRWWGSGEEAAPWTRIAYQLILLLACFGCASSPTLPPQAASLEGHLSELEQRHLEIIRNIHEREGGIIKNARESGALADDVEWYVAGPPEILSFAGTWRGLDGIAEFQRRLAQTMRYDRAELKEYLVSGNNVGVIFVGEGVAKSSGRPFKSEILRLYTFRSGKVVRVRNFYDTASYVAAVTGDQASK